MQDDVVVGFDRVTKVYRLGRRRQDTLKETILSSYRRAKGERFFALDTVSFQVRRGEILGIIGDNGSGKSTILKMAAGITRPTSGRLTVSGRVSALLEVGAGFHPEMTGRENIFLSGAILGIPEDELKRRYDRIVAFAELEEFIDTPVKFYSSGMYMRLGFSIAMNVDPDILLVDEVLSVGDSFFQHRCREHMQQVRRSGKTILLVSHDLIMIQLLCSRALFLDHGRVVMEGHPSDAVFEYQKHVQSRQLEATTSRSAVAQGFHNRDGTQEVSITGVRFLDREGREQDQYELCDPLTVAVDFRNYGLRRPATLNISYWDKDRNLLFTSTSRDDGFVIENLPERGTISMSIPEMLLMPGIYFVSVGLFDADTDFFAPDIRDHVIDMHSFRYSFMVRRRERAGKLAGFVYLHRSWKLEAGGRS